jgi:hypothetical protein
VGALNAGKKLEYASALYVSTYRGLPTVSHGGSWAGYRAQLLRFPKQKLSVACLCPNGGAANPSRLAQKVAEVYLGDQMKPAEERKAPDAAAPTPAPPEAAAWTGMYRNSADGGILIVSLAEGILAVEFQGNTYKLSSLGGARFGLSGASGERREFSFEPVPGKARPRLQITSTDDDGEEKETFEPVERWTPSAADLAGFAGTYASRELDTTWRLVVEKGQLFVRHRGISTQAMTPTLRDAFTLDGMNLVFRRSGGKATGFTLDAGRVRGVAFARAAE